MVNKIIIEKYGRRMIKNNNPNWRTAMKEPKREETRTWWDLLNRCRARTKKGKFCNNYTRKAYEIKAGNLYIPLTCAKHIEQEEKIRDGGLDNE